MYDDRFSILEYFLSLIKFNFILTEKFKSEDLNSSIVVEIQYLYLNINSRS